MEGYPTRKRQRLRDFDYAADGFYFVTVCTAGRRACLVGELAAIVRREILALTARFPGTHVCEQILMPDHLHFILQLDGATAPLPRIIQAFKSLTAIAAARISSESGNRLWQRGYYERVSRNENELLALRQYLRNNPLAAQTNGL